MSKTRRYGRERGGYAAKDHGQESNPGCCGQDWALMVRALPIEPPGHPQKVKLRLLLLELEMRSRARQGCLRHVMESRSTSCDGE